VTIPATELMIGELVADRVFALLRWLAMMGSEISIVPSCMYSPRRELLCFRLVVEKLAGDSRAEIAVVASMRPAADTAVSVTGTPSHQYSLHTTRGFVALTDIFTFSS